MFAIVNYRKFLYSFHFLDIVKGHYICNIAHKNFASLFKINAIFKTEMISKLNKNCWKID